MIVAMGVADRGSIRWHQNRWEVRVQVDGRRLTKRVKASNTRAGRRVAEDALDVLVQSATVGDEGMTVAEVLARYELLKGPGWSPSTRASFVPHTAPFGVIGHLEVASLRRGDLENLYAGWMAGGVAASTVRRRHSILAAALRQAERWGVIAVSPARDVELDAVVAAPADDLPPMVEVLSAILRITHWRLSMAAWLAVVTGARRGELVGLRWRDVDLDGGVVRFGGAMAVGPEGAVRKSTKSGRPKSVAIDGGTVARLRTWRSLVVEESLAAGASVGPGSPVFPSPTDPTTPWHPGQVTLQWSRARDGVGLGGVRFHDLRHLHATHLIAAGIPVTTVSARLGHASTRMTLDVYSHSMPAADVAAAAVIGEATEAATTG